MLTLGATRAPRRGHSKRGLRGLGGTPVSPRSRGCVAPGVTDRVRPLHLSEPPFPHRPSGVSAWQPGCIFARGKESRRFQDAGATTSAPLEVVGIEMTSSVLLGAARNPALPSSSWKPEHPGGGVGAALGQLLEGKSSLSRRIRKMVTRKVPVKFTQGCQGPRHSFWS